MTEPTTEEIDTALDVIDHFRDETHSSTRKAALSGAESVIQNMSDHGE